LNSCLEDIQLIVDRKFVGLDVEQQEAVECQQEKDEEDLIFIYLKNNLKWVTITNA